MLRIPRHKAIDRTTVWTKPSPTFSGSSDQTNERWSRVQSSSSMPFAHVKKNSILTPFILYHPLRIMTSTIPCVPSQKCPEVWWTWYDFVACSCRAVAGQLQLLRGVVHLAAVPRKDGGRPLPHADVKKQCTKSSNIKQYISGKYDKQSIHFSTWTCGTLAAYCNLAIVHMCILSCAKSP